jgi:uncharacterized protein YjbI with pentapeptide repeats
MKNEKKKLKVIRPRLPAKLEILEGQKLRLEDEDRISGVSVAECVIENQSAMRIELKQVLFRNAIFKDVELQNADIVDARFENCDLSNLDFRDSIIHRTEFKNCKMIGCNLSDALLQNVVMENCNLDYSNLRFSCLKKVEIKDSRFCNADCQGSKFIEVAFDGVDFSRCRMAGTSLEDIDISSCEINEMGIGMEDIQGAIVSLNQAVMLSRLMGISIKES